MPQDSRRLIGYKSFVTCNDPKGVVECGMIRRSNKNCSKDTEHKIQSRSESTTKHSQKSFAHKTDNEESIKQKVAEDFHRPTSFQLLEVKPNHTVESWSKGIKFDGRYDENIAKDLLRGALDLQESLVMLEKLQAATKFVAQLKQKQEKADDVHRHECEVKKMDLSLCEERDGLVRLQNPSLARDGTSEEKVEELTRAIKESFARQHLLPSAIYCGKDHFHQPNIDSGSVLPSTSSSQCSTTHFDDNDSVYSSFPLVTSWERARGPSIVAKLMGLEELPLKLARSPPRKKLEHNKHQERPVFDKTIPRMKTAELNTPKVDSAQRTLKEIIETMRFKGLLKGDPPKKSKPLMQLFDEYDSEQRSVADVPPVVLMKPLHAPCLETKEHCFLEEGVLQTQVTLKMPKLKEERLASCPEKTCTISEEPQTSVTRPTLERAEKKCKEDVSKLNMGKTTGKATKKAKSPAPLNKHPLRKESSERKSPENKSATRINRKFLEESSKTKCSLRSQNNAMVNMEKPLKLRKEPINKKDRSPQRSKNLQSISKPRREAPVKNSGVQKRVQTKKQGPGNEKELRKFKKKDIESTLHGVKTDLTSEIHSVKDEKIEIDSADANQQPIKENKDAAEFEPGEDCGNSQTSLVVTELPTLKDESDHPVKASNSVTPSEHEESFKSKYNTQAFLSNDPSFLAYVDEFLEVASSPAVCKNFEESGFKPANKRLYLDCAKELVEQKSLQVFRSSHFLSIILQGSSRICISMDKLLEEICDAIEQLNEFCEFASAKLTVDGLYEVLKRDISSKGLMNGMWNSAWRNSYSFHDVEQVVSDMEKILLGQLVEEAVTELGVSFWV